MFDFVVVGLCRFGVDAGLINCSFGLVVGTRTLGGLVTTTFLEQWVVCILGYVRQQFLAQVQ